MRTFDASGKVDMITLVGSENELPDGIVSPDSVGNQIWELWRGLALMPTNYDDVCREWLLPSGLGELTT